VVVVSVVCPHSYWIFFVRAELPLAPTTTTTTTTTATTFPNNSTKKTHLGELPLFLSGKICFLHPSHSPQVVNLLDSHMGRFFSGFSISGEMGHDGPHGFSIPSSGLVLLTSKSYIVT